MTTVYIADTGVFVRCGGPDKDKFQRLRRALRQAGVSSRIPKRVYEELGAILQRTSTPRETFRRIRRRVIKPVRGTLADDSLDVNEEDCRREIAREWEQLQRRIEIVGFAIREWDFLAPTTERTEVNS